MPNSKLPMCSPTRATSTLAWLIFSSTLACCGKSTPEAVPPAAPPPPTSAPELEATASAAPPDADAAAPVAAAPLTLPDAIVVPGMSSPESALYDREQDSYLVSNVVGTPFAVDDKAFISKVAPDGTVVDLKWIDSAKPNVTLNAPKGMAITGGILYVADLDHVRKFDAKTGAPRGAIAFKGATFLNDVSAKADGRLFVTDSGIKAGKGDKFEPTNTDAVYEIVNDKPKVVVKGTDLNGPNGILANESGVWVVTLRGHELYDVSGGKKDNVNELPKGMLDGLTQNAGSRLLISSWESSQVFQGVPGEAFNPLPGTFKGAADIGFDTKRTRLLIPAFTENELRIQPLGSPTPPRLQGSTPNPSSNGEK
jgi:hypothetical protein